MASGMPLHLSLLSSLSQTDRARKGAENELADLSDRVGELTANNNTLASQRRKAEQELQSVQSELEEAINEARNNEDKAKKAISDVRCEIFTKFKYVWQRL